ncbi:hypothetical protein OUZ56_032468 [Daphnia magna]|uniref:Uncharacterized protein n=1 Tax=Daphnia magna TaxID=35525 RepID=A0ABR0B9F2_9CRUS|nr:hypothetical protein OUZ56_032468 [Daphnia magna]
MAPPSPVVTAFLGWNEKQPASPKEPAAPFAFRAPSAHAASSIHGSLYSAAIAEISATFASWPNVWTTRIAFVRRASSRFANVFASVSRSACGETLKVSGSMSTNTGSAPRSAMTLAVDSHEAAVQFETATTCSVPMCGFSAASKAATSAPCTKKPVRRTRETASTSLSSIDGTLRRIISPPRTNWRCGGSPLRGPLVPQNQAISWLLRRPEREVRRRRRRVQHG